MFDTITLILYYDMFLIAEHNLNYFLLTIFIMLRIFDYAGDDPMTPSQAWANAGEFFHDIRAPLFDQFRVTIVEDSAGGCFNGYLSQGAASMLYPSLFTNIILLASIVLFTEWL